MSFLHIRDATNSDYIWHFYGAGPVRLTAGKNNPTLQTDDLYIEQ
jgi:hypothetical protein